MSHCHQNDNELLYLIRQGDEEALSLLIDAYKRIIRAYVHGYSCKVKTSCDLEDLYQECIIALYKAANTYKETMDCKFSSYYRVVMERTCYNYLRSAYNLKNRANQSLLSLDQYVCEQGGLLIGDIIACDPCIEPTWAFEIKQQMVSIRRCVKNMGEKEQKIFTLWEQDYSYKEISRILSEAEKTIDNTMYRLKKDLRIQMMSAGYKLPSKK
ncbi:RNA polymerase sigma-30 (SigH) subunit [Breznakia blatticola]|uniref:RNA polymerase sigma-30 (SigH) subunit n=1 Tax=Breznakia blatticola TaxID=1754012 RepID=A0A4R7ZGE5_9FIRM|nr:sigma-70 family RNA polymerase sigma factor [Breznakia blatticola]TDW16727.1 RNA polymerase sigma-30 (SigH) subunit [Breznakia blatticola]